MRKFCVSILIAVVLMNVCMISALAQTEAIPMPRFSTIQNVNFKISDTSGVLQCTTVCEAKYKTDIKIQTIIEEKVNGKYYTRLSESDSNSAIRFVVKKQYPCTSGQQFRITMKVSAGSDSPIKVVERTIK